MIFYLDWDIDFDAVTSTFLFRRLKDYAKEENALIYIRKSAHGNTHVMVQVPRILTVLETFEARAWLGDDPFRIALDLKRLRSGGEIDRLFDVKIIKGQVLKAGEWIAV